MDTGLAGKVAVVTGAGSPRGMGRAIVEALAAEGVHIAASDVGSPEPDPLMQMMDYRYGADEGLDATVEAAKALGVEAIGVRADVSDPEEVEALIAATASRLGGPDILVNVAGGSWGSNRTGDYDPEQWMKTVEINLFGTFLTTHYALPKMEAQGWGSIVNIGSMAAVRSHPMLSAYGAAKAGVAQFTRDVATEYGPQGIRANCLLPGDIRTDMFAMECKGMAMMLGMSEDEVAQLSAETAPLKRLGEVADIAGLVVFLCSKQASFLTGLSIPVAGGKDLPFKAH